jgi:hypothetical protein
MCAAATPPNHSTVTVLRRKPIQGDGHVVHGRVTVDLICADLSLRLAFEFVAFEKA